MVLLHSLIDRVANAEVRVTAEVADSGYQRRTLGGPDCTPRLVSLASRVQPYEGSALVPGSIQVVMATLDIQARVLAGHSNLGLFFS